VEHLAQLAQRVAHNLRVLIADEDRDALRELGEVLHGLGHEVAPYVVSVAEAIELIGTEDPDLAIVVVHEDDEHALALIQETVEYASGPVLAKTGAEGVEFVARAAERGVAACIDSLKPERVQAAIEIAMRRYQGLDERAAFELLRDHARSNSRRVVDVAVAVADGHALLPPR